MSRDQENIHIEIIDHRIETAILWLVFAVILFTIATSFWEIILAVISVLFFLLSLTLFISKKASLRFNLFFLNSLKVRSPAPFKDWVKFIFVMLYISLFAGAFGIVLVSEMVPHINSLNSAVQQMILVVVIILVFLLVTFRQLYELICPVQRIRSLKAAHLLIPRKNSGYLRAKLRSISVLFCFTILVLTLGPIIKVLDMCKSRLKL